MEISQISVGMVKEENREEAMGDQCAPVGSSLESVKLRTTKLDSPSSEVILVEVVALMISLASGRDNTFTMQNLF